MSKGAKNDETAQGLKIREQNMRLKKFSYALAQAG